MNPKTYSFLLKIGVKLLWITVLLCLHHSVRAQRFAYPSVEERQLIGTKWQYTYTRHVESNTIVHQADKEYQYFIFFKYDFTFEQFLHGTFSKGIWSLNGGTLFYAFRNIQKFDIPVINNKTLILEFQQPNNGGIYEYHFTSVQTADAPFMRPIDELPEIIVEAPPKETTRRKWWQILRGLKNDVKTRDNTVKTPVYISIELIGGGFYGGIDPVVKDFIQIGSDGRLLHEYQTVNQPLRVIRKKISPLELQKFGEYILNTKFFDMSRLYDCNSPACEKRKRMKPTPIPLRLQVSYGDKKKVITIAIWGEDNLKMRYVDYPIEIDKIIEVIRRMTHRLDDKKE